MMNRKSLSRNPLSFALATAVLFAASAPVFAQDSSDQASEGTKSKATNLDTVTVTGSRISKDTFNSVSPVQVVTREESLLAGFNSTTDALQSTAVTAGSSQINNAYGGYVTDGGPGANTLGLRGLGPTRTLILLNGRRVAPAGSRGAVGSADLNVLPNSIVDRIEILKDGASSIYGSDAVAGVINIITKTKVDGVSFEAQHNATDGGGGDQRRYSIMFGATGERSHFSGSYEYYTRNELTLNDRSWTRCATDKYRDIDVADHWGSGDFIDPLTGQSKCYTLDSGGVTINTIGTNTRTGVAAPGGVGTRFNRWRPNAAVTTGLVGYEGVDTFTRDTFDKDMLNQSLISPAKTHTLFFQGGVDIGVLGDAELYYEFLGNKRKSTQTGYRQLSLDYGVGNPLIPANLRDSVAGAPTNLTNGANLGVRAFIGFGNDQSKQNVDYYRFNAGLRGNLGSEWKYDFNVMHSDNDADYTFQSFLTSRLAQSLNVVANGAGGYSCVDPSNGCIAAPGLNSNTIGGNLPADWKNWVFVPVTGNTQYKEDTVNFNVNGPLFDMPYGTAAGAFGVEYRKAKIDDSPSQYSVDGDLFNLTSAAPTRGSDSVFEAYGELELPLLSGVTGAEELTVNLSGRYTDYKSYGSDETYKIGTLWTPVKWLSFRASYGTSYRAPALYEQFLGGTTGFLANTADPCNEYGEREPSSLRYQNCASLGLDPEFQATQGVTVITQGGAETGLKAETSTAKTLGVVLQPEFGAGFGDLSFAVDYFDIKVENGVQDAGGAGILTNCYNSSTADFSAGNGLCRLVERNPLNNALTVTNGFINVSTDKVRGLDFTLRYVRDIGPGEFRTTTQFTHYIEQTNKVFQDDPEVNYSGQLRFPKNTASFDMSYKWKNWQTRYGVEWIDKMESYTYYEEDPATSQYKLYTPNYFLQSFSVQYEADKWSVTGGVRNLADKEPPTISQGVYNTVGNALLYSGFDYFGRTYFMNVTYAF
ncbi:TonB-dependent receptor plug domain-containing protein [Stenotrophomonas rhizophila]|jgi:outer membrane receptor protein involved in Fe transport|uniref:TonB-dependent receptor plug domain-containing protein n=1 Tax=Stenotrophomonas rhizophila TaxID=216778 RepID=UPI0028A86EB2|nr:TonB-dependent receptor [Stenotrophomonas rhizophila]